jgi:hypothetical protein
VESWLADGALTRLARATLPDSDTAWQQRLAAHITSSAGS